MAPFTDQHVMLTLAGLSYRGFANLAPGQSHTDAVRAALLDGLATLPPVKDEWTLIWGPATMRDRGDLFDSAAMYVVRSQRPPTRDVVVIRGTNPVSPTDWFWGDFRVWRTTPWPGDATGSAHVSMSTERGLRQLQAMRSPRVNLQPVVDPNRPAPDVAAQIGKVTQFLRSFADDPVTWLADKVARLAEAVQATPVPSAAGLDLPALLRKEAEDAGAALDVTIAGHSKGGGLAPVVALWLKELLAAAPADRWDGGHGAHVSCYAFAGPTPGNKAFATRIEQAFGPDYHHLRNLNDVVTHAWQDDELQQIPDLYSPRSLAAAKLLPKISDRVRDFHYSQPGGTEVRSFRGQLDPGRAAELEFVHQHLEAYLEKLDLLKEGVTPATLFL
jgi:triacylglycerol lipase